MQPCSEGYENLQKKIRCKIWTQTAAWKLTKLATGSLEQPIAVRLGRLTLPTFWNDSLTRVFIVRRIDYQTSVVDQRTFERLEASF